MAKFKRGDEVVFVNPATSTLGKDMSHLKGESARIIGDKKTRKANDGSPISCYLLILDNFDGMIYRTREYEIQKKPPEYDGYQKTKWTEGVWIPDQVLNDIPVLEDEH